MAFRLQDLFDILLGLKAENSGPHAWRFTFLVHDRPLASRLPYRVQGHAMCPVHWSLKNQRTAQPMPVADILRRGYACEAKDTLEGLCMLRKEAQLSQIEAPRPQRVTKKHQIIALYLAGITHLEDLATITDAQPSYVGAVLQQAGLIRGYFDLYTSTAHPMNVYSKLFASKLGFKNEEAARNSVAVLERLYEQFALARDRAGQHHALSMALVMFDRARWIGKLREADIFRQWLVAHLEQTDADDGEHTTGHTPEGRRENAGVPIRHC